MQKRKDRNQVYRFIVHAYRFLRYRNSFHWIFFVCFLSFFSFSCEESNKAFTDEENKIIDSLYRVRLKESKTKLDSICDSVYNAEFPVMVDSIKKIRKKEILDLIGE